MAKDSKGHGSNGKGMRGGADYTPNSPGPGFAGTRATKTRLQAEGEAYEKKHAKKGAKKGDYHAVGGKVKSGTPTLPTRRK